MSAEAVEAYINKFPIEVQERLKQIRMLIKEGAPEAVEVLSYGVPGFKLKKNLMNYAAFKKHDGLYPDTSAIEQFQTELEGFETAKGTIRFPHNQPLPIDLIKKIIAYRVQELQG